MDLVSDSDEDVLEVVMVFSVVDLVEFLFLEFFVLVVFWDDSDSDSEGVGV